MTSADRLSTRRCAFCLAGVVAILSVATGCQHPELAERAIDQRQQKLQRTLETLVAHEKGRPQRLSRTLDDLELGLERKTREFDGDLTAIQQYLDDAPKRWNRRQPEIERTLERLLRRSPETIEPTAIRMLY